MESKKQNENRLIETENNRWLPEGMWEEGKIGEGD